MRRKIGSPFRGLVYALAILPCLGISSPISLASPRSVINVAFEDSIRSFDPRHAVDANSQYVEDLIHCSLVIFGPDGQPMAGATSKLPKWIDETKLEVELKPDLRFSNGEAVRAKDVAATYDSLMKNSSFARSTAFSNIKEIDVRGDLSIIFNLKKPDATFITNLVVGILPSTLASQDSIPAEHIIGCGPYRLKTIEVNELKLEINPHAFPVPKTSQINIKIVRNEKTRFFKLQTGEIDVVQNGINRDTLKTVEKRSPNLKVLSRPALRTTYLGFNMRDPITGNPSVREAIAHAIKRQEIIDILLAGMASPATTLIPPYSPFYDKSLEAIPYDPSKAESILDKAGFPKKGPFRFELTFKTTTDITRISIAKAIGSQLKKIGIKVTVEPTEWGRFKMDIERGRVQLWSLTWIGFKDPDIYRYAFATESFPPNGGNRGWYSNRTLDNLLDKGRSVTDQAERIKTYHAVQRIIANDLPYVFLWHEDNFAVVDRKLDGFELYADGRYSSLSRSFFR